MGEEVALAGVAQASTNIPASLSEAAPDGKSPRNNANFRKKFTDRAAFTEARERQRQEARLNKLTGGDGRLLNWRKVSVNEIGERSQSIGIKLYFRFLGRGMTGFAVWAAFAWLLVLACLQPSAYDEQLAVSSLAKFTLATFGDNDPSEPVESRKITLLGNTYTLVEVTPVFAGFMAGGAGFFLLCMINFEVREVSREVESLDKAAVTPSDFTVVIDCLPRILRLARADNQVAPENNYGHFEGQHRAPVPEISMESIVAPTSIFEAQHGADEARVAPEESEEKVASSKKAALLLARAREKSLANKARIEAASNDFHRSSYKTELKRHLEGLVNAERDKRQERGDFVPPSDLGPATVADISLSRDYEGLLGVFKRDFLLKKGLTEAEEDADEKKTTKARKEIEAWNLKKAKAGLGENNVAEADRPVMRAYVTWSLSYDKEVCEELYRNSESSLLRLFQSRSKRFHGHRLRVATAPEPSNLLWENEDLQTGEKILKQTLVLCATVLILLITGALLVATNVQKDTLSAASSTADCPAVVSMQTTTGVNVTFSQQLAEEYLGNITQTAVSTTAVGVNSSTLNSTNTTETVPILCPGLSLCSTFTNCQCSALGLVTLATTEPLRDACDSYFREQVLLNLVTIFASVIVVVVNLLLQTSLDSLVSWERPRSVSMRESSAMGKIFIAQFINTSLLIVLLNAAQLKQYIPASRGDHSDLSHKWFATVGLAVSITMATNVFMPHGLDVIKAKISQWQAGICANCCATSEEQLRDIYASPDFLFSARCAAILNTLFSTLIFAPGCPILVTFAMLSFVLCYWCDRFILLSVCKRPPAYDEAVMLKLMRMVPFAFLAHSAMGVWTMGNQDIFPSLRMQGFDANLKKVGWDGESEEGRNFGVVATFVHRSFYESGFPYFCLFLFTLSYIALKAIYGVFGASLETVCFACVSAVIPSRGRGQREGFAEDETTYQEEKVKWIRGKVVAGYQLGDNPEWRELLGMGALLADEYQKSATKRKKKRDRVDVVDRGGIEEFEEASSSESEDSSEEEESEAISISSLSEVDDE